MSSVPIELVLALGALVLIGLASAIWWHKRGRFRKQHVVFCRDCFYYEKRSKNSGRCHLYPPPFAPTNADMWCGSGKGRIV